MMRKLLWLLPVIVAMPAIAQPTAIIDNETGHVYSVGNPDLTRNLGVQDANFYGTRLTEKVDPERQKFRDQALPGLVETIAPGHPIALVIPDDEAGTTVSLRVRGGICDTTDIVAKVCRDVVIKLPPHAGPIVVDVGEVK